MLGDASEAQGVRRGPAPRPDGGGFGGAGGFRAPGGTTFTMGDLGDFGDLLGGLFGSRRRAPKRGADVETALHLSFDDAVRGVTTSVHLPTDAPCHTCHGTGAAPGTSPVDVRALPRPRRARRRQGDVLAVDDLPGVPGPRRAHRDAVPHVPRLGARGVEPLGARCGSPPGVEGGQRIRVRGKGQPGQQGAPAGDLYVVVHVSRDPRFGRRGRNLTTRAPITFADAALGDERRRRDARRSRDRARARRAPRPGTTLRIRGPRRARAREVTPAGDLLVTIDVTVPTDLTDEQRAAVEEMAKHLEGATKESS